MCIIYIPYTYVYHYYYYINIVLQFCCYCLPYLFSVELHFFVSDNLLFIIIYFLLIFLISPFLVDTFLSLLHLNMAMDNSFSVLTIATEIRNESRWYADTDRTMSESVQDFVRTIRARSTLRLGRQAALCTSLD